MFTAKITGITHLSKQRVQPGVGVVAVLRENKERKYFLAHVQRFEEKPYSMDDKLKPQEYKMCTERGRISLQS
ncbi:hypothetical protein RRG08_040804 [Elysia crispata]|uniref:Uncharacterized protein n=1 Tax=Elysia crispata TaxID=231223 RepID=A0AAE1EDE0_9GAST|nr:hypothetical protein RRG08_040804 [Elysia crispata]